MVNKQEDELLQIIRELQAEFRAEQDELLANYAKSVQKHEERLHQLEKMVEAERMTNGYREPTK